MRCHVPASLGGRRALRSIAPPAAMRGLRSPSSRAVEASVHPGLGGLVNRAVSSQRWPSVPEQTRRLWLQRPRRAKLGLRGAAILPAAPRPPAAGEVLEGLVGASPRPGPGEQGPDGVEEAVRRGRRHRGASSAGERAAAGSRSAGRAAAVRAQVPGVRGTETEAVPGPPGLTRHRPEAAGGPEEEGRPP